MKTIDLMIYLFVCVFVLPLEIMVNKKLYKTIKNEEHKEKGKVVQHMMKIYSLLQCVMWPCLLSFAGAFYLLDLVFEITKSHWTHHVTVAFRFFYGLNRNYLSFNSLIIALTRYLLLTFETKVEAFGIKRFKILLNIISVGVPIFHAILYEFITPIEKDYIALFLSNVSPQNTNNISAWQNASSIGKVYESPIYLTVNQNLFTQ